MRHDQSIRYVYAPAIMVEADDKYIPRLTGYSAVCIIITTLYGDIQHATTVEHFLTTSGCCLGRENKLVTYRGSIQPVQIKMCYMFKKLTEMKCEGKRTRMESYQCRKHDIGKVNVVTATLETSVMYDWNSLLLSDYFHSHIII